MKKARRTATERFAICVTPGPKKTLVALLGLSPTGGVSVRRAAVRSALDAVYAAQAAAEMYRTARIEAPTALIVVHTPGHDQAELLRLTRNQVGPFADLAAVATGGAYSAGTWGTAVRGAASGLGVAMDSRAASRAVMLLAKECEHRATGAD